MTGTPVLLVSSALIVVIHDSLSGISADWSSILEDEIASMCTSGSSKYNCISCTGDVRGRSELPLNTAGSYSTFAVMRIYP